MKVLHNSTLLLHPRKLLLRVCYKIFQTFFPLAMQVHNPFETPLFKKLQNPKKPFTTFVVKIWLELSKVICNLYFSRLNMNIHVSLQKHYCFWLQGSMPSQPPPNPAPPMELLFNRWLLALWKIEKSWIQKHIWLQQFKQKMCTCTNIAIIITIISELGQTLHASLQWDFLYTITHQGYLSTSNRCALLTAMQTWGRRQKERKNKGNPDFKERVKLFKTRPIRTIREIVCKPKVGITQFRAREALRDNSLILLSKRQSEIDRCEDFLAVPAAF